jgi:hypothetical protein
MRYKRPQHHHTKCDAEFSDSRTAPTEAGAVLVGYWSELEGEFSGDLQDTRIAEAGNLAESA